MKMLLFCSIWLSICNAQQTQREFDTSINVTCPESEKISMPRLEVGINDCFFYFPQELLEKAQKNSFVKVKVATFRLLEKEAVCEYRKRQQRTSLFMKIAHLAPEYLTYKIEPKKVSCVSTKLFQIILCLKRHALPQDIIKLIIEEVVKDDEMVVSEADIIHLMPFLRCPGTVPGSLPSNGSFPEYTIHIDGDFKKIACQETAVMFDYQHYKRLMKSGWIRCNDLSNNKNVNNRDIFWYLPRYIVIDKLPHYWAPYGPRFREVIDGQEHTKHKEYGDVWEYYDFTKDPLYNFKTPDFLT